MRIAIDVHPLQTATRFGNIGCYLRNVLQQICSLDGENEYTFLLNNSAAFASATTPSVSWRKHYLTRKHCLGRWWWSWDTVHLPTVFIKKDIDLYHYNSLTEFENMTPPTPFGKHRVVATIYDLSRFTFPRYLPPSAFPASASRDAAYSAKLGYLKHADAIITLSASLKQEIVRLLDFPEEQVFIARCGVSDTMKQRPSQSQLDRFLEKYHLPEHFILYLGEYGTSRENLARLLKAYKLLRQNVLLPKPYLVLAGLSHPEHQAQIFTLIRELEIALHIIPLPDVTEDELPCLYRAAKLLVYPSLYENFGLPVAEALACGTVVIASNTAALPEIIGDAGLYFDPCNEQLIAEAMYEGLTNTNMRAILQEKGPTQAAQFSWNQTARSILTVYKNVHF